MKRVLAVALLAMMAVSLLGACGSSAPGNNTQATGTQSATTAPPPQTQSPIVTKAPEGDIAEGQMLRLMSYYSPSGKFNPALTTDDVDAQVTALVFDSLVRITPDYSFDPCLAKSWEVSDDNKTIVFKLQENVKWHDGEPFTADDVAFTLKFVGDPNYPGQFSSRVTSILGMNEYKAGTAADVEGIKVIDANTISITTADVYAPFFLDMSGMYIIAEHIWKDVDIAKALEATDVLANPIGTGIFILDDYGIDQYYSFVRNDDYWQGVPKIEKIFIEIGNEAIAQGKLLNGEIDMMDLTVMDTEDIQMFQDAGFDLKVGYWTAYRDLGCNLRNDFLAIKEVRQALMYSLNRQGICDSVFNGYATIADTCYAPFLWGYPGADKLVHYDYNPDKAIEMLTAVEGCEYTSDGKLLFKGQPVSLRLPTSQNTAIELALAVIQDNFKDIGVDLKVEFIEFAALLELVATGEGYDLYYMGRGTGSDADARLMFHSSSIPTSNYQAYSNPEVDQLLEEGVKFLNVEERKPYYHRVAQILNDELPSLFICHWGGGTVIDPSLVNFNITTNSLYFNLVNWYFE